MRSGERDAVALVLGFALDRVVGDPAHRHPVGGFGRLASALERRTWRPRRRAGIAHVALLLVTAASIGRRAGGTPVTSALVVWVALGGRSLERAALRMAELLRVGDLP